MLQSSYFRKDVLFDKKHHTVLLIGKLNTIVDIQTVISGMGLDFRAQRKKNPVLRNKAVPIGPPTIQCIDYRALTLEKIFIQDYLDSITTKKVNRTSRKSVQLYKDQFIDFIDQETQAESESRADYFMESESGVIQMINETICRAQNQGAVKLVAKVLWGMMNCETLTEDGLRLTNPIDDLVDLASKNKLK